MNEAGTRGNKMVGKIMNEVYDMWLEKKFKTKKEGLKIGVDNDEG